MSPKKVILDTIDDLVSSFLFYDRKEDEELPRGAIDQAVADNVISVDEMVARFRVKLEEGLQ